MCLVAPLDAVAPRRSRCRIPNRYALRVLTESAAPAAVAYALITIGVVVFQIALALGAPWGRYAMGGSVPGRFPPAMRVLALIQAALLVGLALIVLVDAGVLAANAPLALPWLIWVPVAVSAVALVLNVVTPSSAERRIWAPVAALLLLTSLVVALSPS